MNTRQHSDSYCGIPQQIKFCSLRILVIVYISFFSFSCDKPLLIVESTAESDQVFSVSVNRGNYLGEMPTGTRNDPKNNGSPDSSLTIISELSYSLAQDTLIVTETFDLRLIHKLSSDSTLDYGNVKFGDMQLNRSGNQLSKWIYWNYVAQLMNTRMNSAYSVWTEACNLQQPAMITISQSPDVKETAQLLYTVTPATIVNLQTGGMLNTASDLEIVFDRTLQKGAVISIGNDTANWYYHFELLRSSSRLTVPAKYIQSLKGSSSTVKCRIFLVENLFIGVITTEAKTGQEYYHLPVYEITRYGTMITLY